MTELFGRLSPGATLEQANAELQTVYASMMKDHPEAYAPNGQNQIHAVLLRDQITSGAKTVLLVLLGGIGIDFHHRMLKRRQLTPLRRSRIPARPRDDVEQGLRARRGDVRRSESRGDDRDVFDAGRVRAGSHGRQRHGARGLDARREGRTAAAPDAADAGRHQAAHDHEPALDGAHEGADHVVDSALHRSDQPRPTSPAGPAGGIDNFVEAAKALRGEPHGAHKGYVFSNAWVHQTVESMSLALMVDPQGDKEILAAQAKMRATLDDWIPKILAAQHPDGYLQTAFTLRDHGAGSGRETAWIARRARGNHEGYVGRLLHRVGHQSLHDDRPQGRAAVQRREEAGRLLGRPHRPGAEAGVVRRPPGDGTGARALRPVRQREWKAGGQRRPLHRAREVPARLPQGRHRVRPEPPARACSSTRRSATRCARSTPTRAWPTSPSKRTTWTTRAPSSRSGTTSSIAKYYVTGGVGSGETSEGFGPNYSLRNNAYCESCSSCGEIFFQWKLHLAYHDAKYADLYEQTLYNALLGALDLDGQELLLRQSARRERAALRRGTPARAASATSRGRC